MTEQTKHPSHETRFSDASTYDEVCEKCGATDVAGGGWGRLAELCPGGGIRKGELTMFFSRPAHPKTVISVKDLNSNREGD